MAQRWIRRLGTKRSGFRYAAPDGASVRGAGVERIARLGIPPAWTEVHVALDTRAPIQAWGLDARGRKQYRYHARAVERGELRKHYRVRQMARELPAIRRSLAADFRKPAFSREQVASAVVKLIEAGFLRVGSERYAKENRTYGIATMRKSHVRTEGDHIIFEYRGKRSIMQTQRIVDPALARFIERLVMTPGTRLFRWFDGDSWRDLTARDINDYLRDDLGIPYTAKDFRTWGGTLRVAIVLAHLGPAPTERERKSNVAKAVVFVASDLGNTPTICRKSYVHPVLISRYLKENATIAPLLKRQTRTARDGMGHSPDERALLTFLDEHFPERRGKRR